MTLELAQVIAQLVQAIAAVREAEGGQDGLMDLLRRPAPDVRSTVQEDFHQPDDARLVDLDAGIAHRADGDRQSDALQERKVDVNVEPVGEAMYWSCLPTISWRMSISIQQASRATSSA